MHRQFDEGVRTGIRSEARNTREGLESYLERVTVALIKPEHFNLPNLPKGVCIGQRTQALAAPASLPCSASSGQGCG